MRYRARVAQTVSIADLIQRASKPLSALPRPFLKWAGSKRLILPKIVGHIPNKYGVYYEPFLGSGALFFLLCPKQAILSDTCKELIDTFCAVRDNVVGVLEHLRSFSATKTTFYHLRRNRSVDPIKRAAEFIFLNKTCWNGLYRVNSKGIFNVPFGKPKGSFIVEPRNMLYCSNALNKRRIYIKPQDFEEITKSAETGDLVYLDPPYVTGHTNNGFRDYNRKLFSWEDQQRLAQVANELIRRKVHVIASNAYHPAILKLYKGFKVHSIERKSTLASDIFKRGRVCEALFVSR